MSDITQLSSLLPDDEESKMLLKEVEALLAEALITEEQFLELMNSLNHGLIAEVNQQLDTYGRAVVDPPVYGSSDTPVLKFQASDDLPIRDLYVISSEELPEPEVLTKDILSYVEEEL